jgi:RND family efflux transporter MFP subunit
MMRKVLKAVLVLAIVGAGYGIFYYLKTSREVPHKQPPGQRPTLVEVIEAKPAGEPVTVSAMGTVTAAQTVTVFPEVGGRIIYQSNRLVPGGRFSKGQVLVKIDPTDYDLTIKQQQARVVQARMELARERGLKSVAEREWKLIQDEVQPTEEGKKLALREIQLENAQAAVDAAQSTLDQARLMRERTVITAPFNAVVTEEFVDRGQVVSVATRIATLVATDKFWVQVSVPVDRLSWIQIPGVNSQEGSPAEVVQQAGTELEIKRQGRVIKLEGSLDPKGKMARLLVEVDDPLGTPGDHGTVMPLLLGSYVSMQILGPQVPDALALPRRALREKSRVWVMKDKQMQIRKVEVIWSRGDIVFVRGDLRLGEAVVTSRIVTPIEGMLLYTKDDEPAAPRGRSEGEEAS